MVYEMNKKIYDGLSETSKYILRGGDIKTPSDLNCPEDTGTQKLIKMLMVLIIIILIFVSINLYTTIMASGEDVVEEKDVEEFYNRDSNVSSSLYPTVTESLTDKNTLSDSYDTINEDGIPFNKPYESESRMKLQANYASNKYPQGFPSDMSQYSF